MIYYFSFKKKSSIVKRIYDAIPAYKIYHDCKECYYSITIGISQTKATLLQWSLLTDHYWKSALLVYTCFARHHADALS